MVPLLVGDYLRVSDLLAAGQEMYVSDTKALVPFLFEVSFLKCFQVQMLVEITLPSHLHVAAITEPPTYYGVLSSALWYSVIFC